jgi:hypothetical protein
MLRDIERAPRSKPITSSAICSNVQVRRSPSERCYSELLFRTSRPTRRDGPGRPAGRTLRIKLVLELGLASLTQAGEDADATRASRIGKLMTAAAAARAISLLVRRPSSSTPTCAKRMTSALSSTKPLHVLAISILR